MLPGMSERLTGTVRQVARDDRDTRDRWLLVVNLPREPVVGADGRQERDARGRPRWRYPKRERTIEASGERAADRALEAWISELEEQRTRDARRLTVAGLADRWIAAIADHEIRLKTVAFYRDNLRLHVLPAIGAIGALELQPSDLTRLYAAKRAAGLSETSIRHVHATVDALYAWSIREQILESNPCRRVKKRQRPRQERRELVTWDQETIARALALAVERRRGREPTPIRLVRIPLVLAAWCGLRDGEICGLRWSDLDLERGILTVARGVQYAGGELHVMPPKSKTSARSIPIAAPVVEILAEHKRAQDELRLAHRGRWNRLGYVLCTRDGGPCNPDTISSTWARFVRSRELPPITLHGLRHSYATDLFEHAAGGAESALKIVQERLGHSSPAITAAIYLHVTERADSAATEDQARRIAEALEAEARKDPQPATDAGGDVIPFPSRRSGA